LKGIASLLFEAMSMESAVVGANVGGQAELVISEEVGFLVDRHKGRRSFLCR
jgi:glycosyltransferase involved in cell wall biosynthesis